MRRAVCRVVKLRQVCVWFRFSCRLVGGTPKYKLSRADRIRTCDLFVPNEARYQTALQLDVMVMTRGFYSKNQDLQV